MDGDRCHAAIRAMQAMMTASGANNDEAGFLKSDDDFAAREAWQPVHAETVTR
jgi:hypothetical protein